MFIWEIGVRVPKKYIVLMVITFLMIWILPACVVLLEIKYVAGVDLSGEFIEHALIVFFGIACALVAVLCMILWAWLQKKNAQNSNQ